MASDGERIGRLETGQAATVTRLDTVEQTLVAMGNKIDAILSTITESAKAPVFNPYQIVDFIRSIVVIFGVIAGGILWMANQVGYGASEPLRVRVDAMKERQDWIVKKIDAVTTWQPKQDLSK